MKVNVVFSTIVGRVAVESELDYSVNDNVLNGVDDAWKDGLTARVLIPKDDPKRWYEGHRDYKLEFRMAVMHDIRLLREQNEMYLSKETDGRHQVDLKSLKINEIWVDGKFLRLEWLFTDCYGTKRVFAGCQYVINKGYRDEKDTYSCGMPVELQVYF